MPVIGGMVADAVERRRMVLLGPVARERGGGTGGSLTTVPVSIVSGGVLCLIGVLAHALFVPSSRDYEATAPMANGKTVEIP